MANPRTPFVSLILLAGLFPPASALAEDTSCPELTLGADIQAAATEAELAFAATKVEAFLAATDQLVRLVPCLLEPVEPAVAAHVHRMVGLRSFVQRDQDKARQAFASARVLEPAYAWPEEVIPWGHPLLSIYGALDTEDAVFETPPAPPAGWVYMDGRPSEPRPQEWPTLMQVSDAEGAVRLSAYLWPSEQLPDYGVAEAEPLVELAPDPSGAPDDIPITGAATTTTVRSGPRAWTLATAGGAAVASGVLYALASRSARQYADPQTPFEDLDASRRRTNGLVFASAGAAGVALGTGVAAFITIQW